MSCVHVTKCVHMYICLNVWFHCNNRHEFND